MSGLTCLYGTQQQVFPYEQKICFTKKKKLQAHSSNFCWQLAPKKKQTQGNKNTNNYQRHIAKCIICVCAFTDTPSPCTKEPNTYIKTQYNILNLGFWDVVLSTFIGGYQHLGGTH
jgi:hypothetical protein